MAYCPICGDLLPSASFCPKCGSNSTENHSSSFRVGAHLIYISQCVALVLGIGALLGIAVVQLPVVWQLLLVVLEIACCLTLGRFPSAVRLANRIEAVFVKYRQESRKGGRFSRWVLRPALALADSGTVLTRTIGDPVVRSSTQLSLWLLFGAISTILVIYVGLLIAIVIVALLLCWFSLWVLEKANEGESGGRRRSWPVTLSRDRDGIRVRKPGVFGDEDLGVARKTSADTYEVNRVFGPNIELTEKRTVFGSPDPDQPYEIRTEDGTTGHVKRRWDGEYEVEEDPQRGGK